MAGDRGRSRFAAPALVVIAAALASVVYTYPLVRHLDDGIPYAYGVTPEQRVQVLQPGDPLQFYYALALTDDMVHGRSPWFEDPLQFSAPQAPRLKSYFFLPFSLVFAALAPLGRTAAYDLLMLLSFPSTALCAFLLARRIGISELGAAFTAAALTLLPYRVANVAGGHPTGLAFFLMPLTLLGLETAWQRRSARAACLAGIGLLGLSVNEPHFLFFFSFLGPIWLLFALWRIEPGRSIEDLGACVGWLAAAAIGPASAWIVYQMRHEHASWPVTSALALVLVGFAVLTLAWRITAEIRARAGRPAWLAEARSYGALILLALYPIQLAIDVPHLGAAIALATAVVFGILKLPVAAALPAVAARTEYREAGRRLARLWPAAVGFAGGIKLLMDYKRAYIDPAGHAGGRSLHEIALFSPSWIDYVSRTNNSLASELYPGVAVAALGLVALVDGRGRALVVVALVFAALTLGPTGPSWLPLYALAFHAVPFFSIIRQPAKLFAIVAIALALAAGIGADRLRLALGRGRGAAAVTAALAVLLVDFAKVVPLGITLLPARNAVYEEIARRAAGTNLLELSLWPGDSAISSIYQYWATKTRVPMVNGYNPTVSRAYVERVFRPLDSMNLGELTEPQHRLLDELRVKLITLHRDAYPPQVSVFPYRYALDALRRNPNLREIMNDGGVYLFERIGAPYRPWAGTAPWSLGAFFEAESLKIGAGGAAEEEGASGRAFVHGTGDTTRPVVFGPYRTLPRGRYEVRFRARGAGRIEVAADLGASVLASEEIAGASWSEAALAVVAERPRRVEFRGWSRGATEPLDVDWVLVTKRDALADDRPPARFEAEELSGLYGGDGESADASAGAYAVIADDVPGQVVRDGPYRELGPGTLRVAVRARHGSFRLRVESADGLRRFGEWRVPSSAAWTDVERRIELPEREILCTRLVSAGERAEVDYVELTSPQPRAPRREAAPTGTSGGAARP